VIFLVLFKGYFLLASLFTEHKQTSIWRELMIMIADFEILFCRLRNLAVYGNVLKFLNFLLKKRFWNWSNFQPRPKTKFRISEYI